MMTALGRHSLIDLTIKASGDTRIDVHHTVEDVAIVFGEALAQALGDKRGIRRFADATVPLDEALARAVVDISGRPYAVCTGEPEGFEYAMIGGHFTGSLVRHVMESIALHAGICLHLTVLSGRDPHHIAEAEFKALAVMVTRLASAELLAAFCQISDISAWCIQAREGAVAVLRNLDGDGPEAAIRDLTTVVSGLSAILAVNRADKLEVTLWISGQSGQTLAPPILFAATADFVEDLMIGTTTVDRLRQDGAAVFDSGEYNREKAMGIIASHTRFGAGGSTRQGRVE